MTKSDKQIGQILYNNNVVKMDPSDANSHRFDRNPWLAWLVCGIIIAATLFDVVRAFLNGDFQGNPLQVAIRFIELSMPITFALVGALILSRQPRNAIGWLVIVPALTFVLDYFTRPIIYSVTTPPAAPSPWLLLALYVNGTSWIFFIFPLFLIALVFPTGNPVTPRWRWVIAYAIGMILFFLLIALFARNYEPAVEGLDWSVPNPIGFIEAATMNVILSTPWGIALGILTILSVAALIVRYRRSRGRERQQLKWLLYVCGLFTIVYVPLAITADGELPGQLLNDLFEFLFLLSIFAFPIAIGIAILRYQLYDIDVIINRTLVYGTLTALVISLYVFIVGYLGSLLRTENNLLISLFATGLVAVLFQPMRGWLQLGVNRLVYGRRDEPVAVLSQLGARLEQAIVPDEILPWLVDTVARALKLPYVAIALQVGGEFHIRAESGRRTDSLEVFPLIYQGETIGQLMVGRRATREDFNPADRLLLTNIARQAGAVAYSVRLNAALQQSRQQLVTAREEERRRLRRDLHDGLGPQLASQTLTIEAIRKQLEANPGKARDLLNHLNAQSQAAIQDIRRLVYGLRPPALDELGLLGALREAMKQHGQAGECVEITAIPDPLPVLPAAVEVAVYRIAQESITNVLRHAEARQCTVSITAQDHHLDLIIADNGRGYPVDFHYGIGLNSMRERAEELGGTIRFENQTAGGARVHVWLPLLGDEE